MTPPVGRPRRGILAPISAVKLPLSARAAYTTEPMYRFTVEQWHELIDRGKLTADDPVELIEAFPVFKMPKNPPHVAAIGLVTDVLSPLLPGGWHVRTQASITLADGEPEPDGAIARGRRLDYSGRHPGPADVALLIEVSDSTLDRDRGMKLRTYARAGVCCYWIVNLVDRQVEVYADPAPTADVPRYGPPAVYMPGDAVPLTLDGQLVGHVGVADVLPPA